MRFPISIVTLLTLISPSLIWAQGSTKVVLEDMGNVGFRISDAQSLANWVSSSLGKRVGHENVAYEGLLKSKKDLARRLGNTEIHPTQAADIQRLEAFVKEAQVWVKARFGKDKKGHWVDLSCRSSQDKTQKPKEKKRFYAKTFHELQPAIRTALADFCSTLIPKAGTPPVVVTPVKPTGILPTQKRPTKEKWLPPTRR